jgi:predicted metal-dependent phosphoesterase TrpH
MAADLHMHSRCSDGSLPVEALIDLARKNKVETISITDHDSTVSLKRAILAGESKGINIIPGIEISAWDPKYKQKIHVLGYSFRKQSKHIENLCKPIRLARHKNTLKQVKLLENSGYPVSLKEVLAEANNDDDEGILYKQHIMAVLIRKGEAQSMYGRVYNLLFKNNGIVQMDIEYVNYKNAVDAILADGGLPVLAHPGLIKNRTNLEDICSAGFMGIEYWHPGNSRKVQKELEDRGILTEMILTGGSDFHGTYGDEPIVGTYTTPDSYGELLKAHHQKLTYI